MLTRPHRASRLRRKVDASVVIQRAVRWAHEKAGQFQRRNETECLGWLRAVLASVSRPLMLDRVAGPGPEPTLRLDLDCSSLRPREWPAADQFSPSQGTSRREQVVWHAASLSRLPEDQREAVLLHQVRGLAVAEVGERMGRSRVAAKGLIFRGLRAFGARLGREG